MSLQIEEDINLAKHTTLQTGGPARYFVRVQNVVEVKEAALLPSKSTASLCLGGGSNVLIDDRGFPGLVVLNELKGREYLEYEEDITLICGSGEVLDEVIAETVTKGYWGWKTSLRFLGQ